MDAERLHEHDPYRPPHGPRSTGAAADADPGLQQLHRCRSRSRVRLPAQRAADQEPRARTAGAGPEEGRQLAFDPGSALFGALPHVGQHLAPLLRAAPALVVAARVAEEIGLGILDALVDAAPE